MWSGCTGAAVHELMTRLKLNIKKKKPQDWRK
jgi:hypothetical protein